MISVFLSKLLTSRQASFTDKDISVFDLLFAMQPIESLVELQKELEKKLGKEGEQLMVEFGRMISDDIIKHFKKKFNLKGKRLESIWLNMFGLSGLGKLEVIKMDSKEARFQTDSSTVAKIYLSKFKKSKKPVCLIISGMLESYTKEVIGKRAKCIETTCVAQGKKYCVFEMKF